MVERRWGKCLQGFRRMAGKNTPAGIRSLVYGMGKGKAGIEGLSVLSGPRRARTVDPRIKSPLLYRLSYRPHCTLLLRDLGVKGGCGRNRIGDLPVLYPHNFIHFRHFEACSSWPNSSAFCQLVALSNTHLLLVRKGLAP